MQSDYAHLIPMYYTIAEDIRRDIREGKYKDGDQVPSEFELARHYQVSRGTVRHAITILFQDGLLRRKQGAGTFVTNRKIEQNFLKLMGFTEVMHAHNLQANAKLLRVDVLQPPQHICDLLQISSSEKAVYIERARYGGDEPLIVERSFFVHRLFEPLLEFDLEESSIYELLATKTNVRLGQARQSIEARLCGPEDAKILNVPLGSPMLLMKRQIYDDVGQAFEYSEDTYRGDRLKFTIKTTPYSRAENWQLATVSAAPLTMNSADDAGP
ncbi:MAG: GntR family transcriptional regulator [Deferribacteres bacterium]|nr:GntR family transcriptional regulator [candidate division KSB1 bacterium]MCB9509611.1 GntR family transcriptional regulator [Deferribacteres bacterium]